MEAIETRIKELEEKAKNNKRVRSKLGGKMQDVNLAVKSIN